VRVSKPMEIRQFGEPFPVSGAESKANRSPWSKVYQFPRVTSFVIGE
jgi:hypothetical protein